jgi:hypothetical protein
VRPFTEWLPGWPGVTVSILLLVLGGLGFLAALALGVTVLVRPELLEPVREWVDVDVDASVLLRIEGPLSAADVEALKARWVEMHGLTERCYRPGCDGWVTGASDYCSLACELAV